MSDADAAADEHTERWPSWATETIRIVKPQPGWSSLAEHFIAEVHHLLGHWLSSEVVHIGSTAIPRLPAKPVIDLQALCPDPDTALPNTHDALAARSWFFVPRHLDLRPWRWLIVRADDTRRHRLAHLHLMKPSEPRWHDQLSFRDRLRTEPALLDEYAALKTRAAAEHPDDREAYSQAKAKFIRRVLT